MGGPVRNRRNSGRRGPMLLAGALLAVAALGAVGFLVLGRGQRAAREAPDARTTEALPPARPSPDATARREQAIAEALRQAPQLNRAAAAMLVADAERRGVSYGDARDWSLLIANRGFAKLPSDQLKELGDLFTRLYASMSKDDKSLVMAYVERLRRGEVGAAATDERARVLMSGGVNALPEAARGRLQALFETSIRSAFEAEEQTANLAAEPEKPAPRTRNEPWGAAVEETQEAGDAGGSEAARAALEENQRAQQEDQRGSEAARLKQELGSREQTARSAQEDVEKAQESLDRAKSVPLKERALGSPEVAAAEKALEAAQERYRTAQAAVDDTMMRIRQLR